MKFGIKANQFALNINNGFNHFSEHLGCHGV